MPGRAVGLAELAKARIHNRMGPFRPPDGVEQVPLVPGPHNRRVLHRNELHPIHRPRCQHRRAITPPELSGRDPRRTLRGGHCQANHHHQTNTAHEPALSVQKRRALYLTQSRRATQFRTPGHPILPRDGAATAILQAHSISSRISAASWTSLGQMERKRPSFVACWAPWGVLMSQPSSSLQTSVPLRCWNLAANSRMAA